MTAYYATPPPGYGVAGAARPPRRANIAGIVLASLGATTAAVGGLIPWYASGDITIHVSDIVSGLDRVDTHGGSKAWLGFGLWVVLGLAAVAALFANVPGPMSTPLRVVGPILGLGGAVGTMVALNDLFGEGHGFTENSKGGLWMVVVGLAVVGVAAVLGPLRTRPPAYAYPATPYGPAY